MSSFYSLYKESLARSFAAFDTGDHSKLESFEKTIFNIEIERLVFNPNADWEKDNDLIYVKDKNFMTIRGQTILNLNFAEWYNNMVYVRSGYVLEKYFSTPDPVTALEKNLVYFENTFGELISEILHENQETILTSSGFDMRSVLEENPYNSDSIYNALAIGSFPVMYNRIFFTSTSLDPTSTTYVTLVKASAIGALRQGDPTSNSPVPPDLRDYFDDLVIATKTSKIATLLPFVRFKKYRKYQTTEIKKPL